MTLTQLRYFIAIADSGLNITTAAERVHATQPGVSKQLKQLEDELGFQLFSRKGKSLHAITPSGRQVATAPATFAAVSPPASSQAKPASGKTILATPKRDLKTVK